MAPSTVERRRHRQREETRGAILEAAVQLLAESGDDDFSIRRLAERSGYTAPTLYQHFGDKDGLVDALIELRFAKLAELLEAASPSPDPVENARRHAHVWLHFALRNPAIYRLLLSPARQRNERLLAAVERARTIMEAPLEELVNAGRIRTGDLETTQQAMFALLHGLTLLTITPSNLELSEDRFHIAIDAMLRGLIAPAPTPPVENP